MIWSNKMKDKVIYNYIGKVLIGFSILFIFPILVCFIYHENTLPFIIPQIISLILGLLLNKINSNNDSIYAKHGFKIVAISWILISIIGAFPIYLNKDANFVDALFETVSGFTTTGATIFNNVENLNKSILFWRSFSHFIGGMGVLVFVVTIIPLSSQGKSMHVLRAEMPGPTVGKLVPGIKKTLLYLYMIYLGLTIAEIILLLFGGMRIFDSILISMGTAGTGGFSVLNSSLASYSTFCKCVVALFMFLFGVNFNLYFLFFIGGIKNIFKSEELRVYILIFIFSVLFVFMNTVNLFASSFRTLIDAIFHVSSIMTSTGYSIGDINIYPTSCRVLMMLLMLISACAGSTCGGFKISRLIIIFKSIKRDLLKLVHPNNIKAITFEGKKVSEDTIKSTCTFMFLYVILIIIMVFIIGFDGFSLEETLNAVFTTFGNVGLCFDITNFSGFSILSKLTFCVGMLLGRLEIFPVLILFMDRNRE